VRLVSFVCPAMDKFWEVVGGADRGGIVVRQGRALDSAKETERLSTGSQLQEKEVVGDRLHYVLVSGSGPATGWVTLRLQNKALVVMVCPQAPSPEVRERPLPLGRKIRVLALHGGGSNTNVMKFQTGQLRRVFGDHCDEWEFLNGGRFWETDQTTDIMVAIAKDMPFYGWYGVESDDTSDRPYTEKLLDLSVNFTYTEVEKSVERVMEHIRSQGPFDVLVGFSQGCVVLHLVAGLLRERGEACPWKVSLLFNGMPVRDPRFARLFETPLTVPSVHIYGRQDHLYEYGKASQQATYVDPVVLEHDEAHKFPTRQPRCKEVYDEVLREVLWHCGVPDT